MSIRGFAWPMRSGDTETPRTVLDSEAIAASIKTILLNAARTRLMRPEFGTSAFDELFELSTPVLSARLRRDTISAIRRNDPRIRISQVTTEVKNSSVIVNVEYVWGNEVDTVSVDVPRIS